MTEHLHCCPFCGSEPKVTQTMYRISCGDYTCPVRPRVEANDLDVATSRWNSRPDTEAAAHGMIKAESLTTDIADAETHNQPDAGVIQGVGEDASAHKRTDAVLSADNRSDGAEGE